MESYVFRVYSNMSILQNGTPILIVNGSLNQDLIAGIFVALILVSGVFDYTVIIDGKHIDKDHIDNFLFTYEVSHTPFRPQLNDYMVVGNMMGWWFVSDTYRLCTFSDISFIQGVISVFEKYNTDFRNYIYGPPFVINRNRVEEMSIDNYDIQPVLQYNGVEAEERPFFEGVYETGEVDYE